MAPCTFPRQALEATVRCGVWYADLPAQVLLSHCGFLLVGEVTVVVLPQSLPQAGQNHGGPVPGSVWTVSSSGGRCRNMDISTGCLGSVQTPLGFILLLPLPPQGDLVPVWATPVCPPISGCGGCIRGSCGDRMGQ